MGLLSKEKREERRANRKEKRDIARTEGTRLRQFLRNPSPNKNPKQGKY